MECFLLYNLWQNCLLVGEHNKPISLTPFSLPFSSGETENFLWSLIILGRIDLFSDKLAVEMVTHLDWSWQGEHWAQWQESLVCIIFYFTDLVLHSNPLCLPLHRRGEYWITKMANVHLLFQISTIPLCLFFLCLDPSLFFIVWFWLIIWNDTWCPRSWISIFRHPSRCWT